MILRFLPLTICLVASTARAQAKPRTADLPRAFRSLAGVALNRDSARSIRLKLGAAPASHVGSGHDSYVTWCYRAQPGDSLITLELMSDNSDMGTRGHALNVIRRRSRPPGRAPTCSDLPAGRPLSTPGGLRLGLSRTDVERLLGVPTRRAGDSLHYEFISKEFMDRSSAAYKHWNTPTYRKECFAGGEPYSDVGADVTVVFRDDRAIEIRLERYDQATC